MSSAERLLGAMLRALENNWRETAWVLASQVISLSGSLALVRLLTGALSPDDYGALGLALTIATLGNVALFGPLAAGVSRYFAVARELGAINSLLQTAGRLFVTLLAILSLFSLPVASIAAAADLAISPTLVLCAILLAGASGASFLSISVRNAERNRRAAAIQVATEMAVKLIACSAMISVGLSLPIYIILAYSSAALLAFLPQYLILSSSYGSAKNPDSGRPARWAAEIKTFSWPFVVTGLFAFAHQTTDRWALELFHSTGEVGLYVAAFQIAYVPMAAVGAFITTLVTPIAYAAAGHAQGDQALRRALGIVRVAAGGFLVISVIASGIAAISHKEIGTLTFGEDFRGASSFIPWLVLGAGLNSSALLLSLEATLRMQSRSLIAPRVGSYTVGALLNVAVAQDYGGHGVAMASVALGSIHLLWVILANRSNAASAESIRFRD
jgi:O-antigen/teichoic acid export membrane protein